MRQTYCTHNIRQSGRTRYTILALATGSLLFFIAGATSDSIAQDVFQGSLNSVSITEITSTNKAPTASFTYIKNEDIVEFSASSSFDPDGNIKIYKWDFGDDTTGTGVIVSHQYIDGIIVPVTLSVFDNLGAATITQKVISLISKFNLSVNFQPPTSIIPDGFEKDSGESFDASRGFGWSKFPTAFTLADYDYATSPDQSYDTNINLSTADGIWEAMVPNGNYTITVCMGDPKYPLGVAAANVEGVTVINNETLSQTNPFFVKSKDVTVTDGRLTLSFEGSGARRRLCWIKIQQI